ncbi:MAG: aminodeoxychorismate/anthranilate synthase component II [Lachnospiraceae bacterium]|nr:aminodeoxychorismate/anthranilate synthase component II [Lachnospiraceae bacterium]MBO5146811.1 aminodeoxychorismate/anthranilate synthase component II [Lachnospiraceae bacterium]
MILLIDNYDSFSFNLVQVIGELIDGKEELKAVRNDALTVEEIMTMNPSHIVLSPGPGKPADAGVCEALIKEANGKIPLLGVCLGHQAICEALGGKITYAPELMHGKQSRVRVNNESLMFKGLPEELEVARYHSLVAARDMIPEQLEVTAVDEKGEVMAVQHKTNPVYGLQFHPESIMTPLGKEMVRNFLNCGQK